LDELIEPTKQPITQIKLGMSSKEYEARKYLESEEVAKQFGLVRIDLRQREDMKRILGRSEAVIERISKGKKELGIFIQKNFPLDKVIV
jgi:hypothetical protein